MSVIEGRYTARTDEPFVVFIIGMWLPLHKNSAALEGGVARAGHPGLLNSPLPSNPIRR